ncbi:hypothetical protein ACQ86N_03740 [Puia sp. P3]|uniref:hypothetical protein n=1 Tax=Puia sp. P3 TaxID=3423952 RepID=UPI003D67B6E4
MKKLSFFCVLSLCVFAACKKSGGSSSDYHFTATIDGQSQSFNTSPLAVKVSNAGVSMIAFEGFAGNQSNPQVMAVSWNSFYAGQNLVVGTYGDTSSKYAIGGNYNPSISVTYVSGSSIMTGGTHMKLTISSIDSTAVRGSFSGDFYLNGDPSSPKKTVTNGDFYVPWKK